MGSRPNGDDNLYRITFAPGWEKEVASLTRRGHMANFFECVKARKEPVSDVWTHHRELTSCHLCNLAMLLKRKLRWDPAKEEFIGDAEANRLLRDADRGYRKGFRIPERI